MMSAGPSGFSTAFAGSCAVVGSWARALCGSANALMPPNAARAIKQAEMAGRIFMI